MRKIIYIDDEDINLDLFRISFRNTYDVHVTQFPEDSLDIIRKEEIKVVITDYKMPGMNGMELIEAVKQVYPDAVCIILSAYLESGVMVEKSKVFRCITKPFRKQEMIAHIEEAFRLVDQAS